MAKGGLWSGKRYLWYIRENIIGVKKIRRVISTDDNRNQE